MIEGENVRSISSAGAGRDNLRALLETLLLAESISPSKCLWVAAPLVKDVEVFNNETGALATLEPAWSRRWIRLTEVLVRMQAVGGRLVLAVPAGDENDAFLNRLEDLSREAGLAASATVCRRVADACLGIVSDAFFLKGCVMLTERGIQIPDGTATLSCEPTSIEFARHEFCRNYGGVL